MTHEEIKISGGYVPINHNPHNHDAIKKWMESLPNVRDLRKAEQAEARYKTLLAIHEIKSAKRKMEVLNICTGN